ncbi:chemotaxis response regulator protein-glutamate methylesterase [Methylocapsa sp. S129]|uniref:protein-glutamate methylesterase/protein-glutamine glutaminase n=1 Tax=Methylocapsa sp. S129 TaxID=1641869 RepID=UPI00131CB058|nr:chemotaxis response regulator protein-glutamate methylesterase [Methylocapsa sp. S129]
MRPVRVLVVDDSATMRGLIRAALERDPEVEVVGQAADPIEARQAIKALNPDVITLDVEMPNMNGIEFLEKIMRLRPMPVIMVSSLTTSGGDATIRALETGAVDCVAKPSSGDEDAFGELPAIVKMAAGAFVRPSAPRRVEPRSSARQTPGYIHDGRVVAIGASTGGVEALIAVLSEFPANCPPTVITQHMPANFTRSLAQRLDRICAPSVSEASDGAALEQGHIYLAPGGRAHLEVVGSRRLYCRLRPGEAVNGHRPSVDVLFASVGKAVGEKAVGVILTGMGRDGAAGLLEMRKAGARTLGQNEASSVIYGMPRVAFEWGAVQKQLPLTRLGQEILTAASPRNP